MPLRRFDVSSRQVCLEIRSQCLIWKTHPSENALQRAFAVASLETVWWFERAWPLIPSLTSHDVLREYKSFGFHSLNRRRNQLYRSRFPRHRQHNDPRRSRHLRDADGCLAIDILVVVRDLSTPDGDTFRPMRRTP